MKIADIRAREIVDSNGNPTVEVDLFTEVALFRAAVPSGAANAGPHEAVELRDLERRFQGRGVLKAVANVNQVIKPRLVGMDVTEQAEIDRIMVEVLDGAGNEWGWTKANLGANAILGVSLAVCRAGAAARELPLYSYVSGLAGYSDAPYIMPVPAFTVIDGGCRSENRLPCQDIAILPVGASNFKEALRMGSAVYTALRDCIRKKFGQDACEAGDEGGFAPGVQDTEEALNMVVEAIMRAGCAGRVKIGVDVSASEFYDDRTGRYDTDYKCPTGSGSDSKKTSHDMVALYQGWLDRYPIIALEDPFARDDFEGFARFTAEVSDSLRIVGDELLATNPKRVRKAVAERVCNTLSVKFTQIGSVTEAIEAVAVAQEAGWHVAVADQSGETEDSFIADFAVGVRAGQIRSGAPCRPERLAKYNQLARIEEELGRGASYAGKTWRLPVTE